MLFALLRETKFSKPSRLESKRRKRMLQHAEDVEGNETFDVNAPELGSFVPAIDPEAVPTMSLAPPKDGPNWVIIRARADGKNGPCYKKGEKDRSGKIV